MNGQYASRAAALAGIAGASLFFAGDMLFYGFVASGADFSRELAMIVDSISSSAIVIGGLLGPLAAWLCCISFAQVKAQLNDQSGLAGITVLGAGSLSMVALGAVHLLWGARGLAMHTCSETSGQCAALTAALKAYWMEAWTYAAVPGYALAVVLAILVLTGRTRYPRWTFLVNPAFTGSILALLPPLPAPVGGVLKAQISPLTCFLPFRPEQPGTGALRKSSTRELQQRAPQSQPRKTPPCLLPAPLASV